jgi:hypothetical protein
VCDRTRFRFACRLVAVVTIAVVVVVALWNIPHITGTIRTFPAVTLKSVKFRFTSIHPRAPDFHFKSVDP